MSDHDELVTRQRERWDALRHRWEVTEVGCPCDRCQSTPPPMTRYPSVTDEET